MKKLLLLALVSIGWSSFAQSWFQVPVATDKRLNDIDFVSNNIGYIGGNDSTLLKTIDGGQTWTQVTHSGIATFGPYHFVDIDFVDELNGWATIGPWSYMHYTTDGGVTWTSANTNDVGAFCYQKTVYALDQNHVFAGGAGCFQSAMIVELNGGAWTEKVDPHETFNTDHYVNRMDFFNNLGIATTNHTYFLRTIDGGQNWDTIAAPISATGVLTDVHIIDALNMVAGYDDNGGGFGILVSSDAGLTWTQDINSATFYYPAYWSVSSSQIGDVYAGAQSQWATGGLMFELTGGFWTYEEVDQPIYAIDTYAEDVVFAVGDSGYVITNQPLGQLGMEEEHLDFEIYPNPTTDVLHVANSQAKISKLTLISLNGSEMQIPIQKNGLEFEVDCAELPNGMYLLRIITLDGENTKRVVKE